jgi:hypothetical protein
MEARRRHAGGISDPSANFREVRRIINLLLKLKRHERKTKAREQEDEQEASGAVRGLP